MAEPRTLLQLPNDILVQHIIIPQFQDGSTEKAFFSIQTVNKTMKSLCNSKQVLSQLNLTKHLVFDSTKDIRYIHFILHCADKGNMRATLIYGLSMGFCFGHHDEAIKYLAKIRDECGIAEYAYGILMIEHPMTRSEGLLILKRLQLIGTEDHLHLCRIQLLQMLNLGLHFKKIFKELIYSCRRGPNCHRRRHSELVLLDGRPMVLRCSDQSAIAIEYNVLQKAIVSKHSLRFPP